MRPFVNSQNTKTYYSLQLICFALFMFIHIICCHALAEYKHVRVCILYLSNKLSFLLPTQA